MNLALYIERSAKAAPDDPAICVGARMLRTRAQLADRVGRLAYGLRQRVGLSPGERVAIVSRNSAHYLEALYAIWHAGLTAVPINAKLHANEIGFILDDVSAGAVFHSPNLTSTVEAACKNAERTAVEMGGADYESYCSGEAAPLATVAANDIAWIFYTSGTTGQPKGAMLSNRNLLAMSACCLLDVDSKAPWRSLLHAAPMSHGSGLYAIPYVMKGGRHIIPESDSFDVDETYQLIAAWPDVSFFAAPTMVNRLANAPGGDEAPNLKSIAYGGAPMHVEDSIRALDRFGPKLVQLYGQGESPMTISALGYDLHADRRHRKWRERLGTVGRPQSLVEVRVADDEDRELPPGEIGEILVRGDTVMAGYWNRPEASAKALANGWLHTGDIGMFDEDGFLSLKDRSKDLIISGGHNIYPREVEEVLMSAEDVSEVAVVGQSDPEWGESVVAFIVTKSGAEIPSSDLDAHCMAQIARFKRPKRYCFVPTLPKNNYGKVVKNDLRAQL